MGAAARASGCRSSSLGRLPLCPWTAARTKGCCQRHGRRQRPRSLPRRPAASSLRCRRLPLADAAAGSVPNGAGPQPSLCAPGGGGGGGSGRAGHFAFACCNTCLAGSTRAAATRIAPARLVSCRSSAVPAEAPIPLHSSARPAASGSIVSTSATAVQLAAGQPSIRASCDR